MLNSGKNEIIGYIMRMENCTREDAEEILDDVLNEINIAIRQGDYELAEDIWIGDIGLDLDYMFMLV